MYRITYTYCKDPNNLRFTDLIITEGIRNNEDMNSLKERIAREEMDDDNKFSVEIVSVFKYDS